MVYYFYPRVLEAFVAQKGFRNIVHFTDDGISGIQFDRPGFMAMIEKVIGELLDELCDKHKGGWKLSGRNIRGFAYTKADGTKVTFRKKIIKTD